MNKIWAGIIGISSIYGIITGRGLALAEALLKIPEEAFYLALTVIGSALMWSGFVRIMETAGIIDLISKWLSPLMRIIFPKLKDEIALKYISTNIAANLFGLGFAATPSGLKGIERLKEISDMPEGVASDDMITFLVLNTAGVTLVPTTVLAIRQSLGSVNPADFMLIGLIGTLVSCICGITADRVFRKPYRV